MKLTGKVTGREAAIVAVAGLIGAVGGWSAWQEAYACAAAAVILLALISIGLQLWVLRRIALRQQSLDRIERKMDVVARRVVTESQALTAEIRRRDT